jgi:hypothetical protein
MAQDDQDQYRQVNPEDYYGYEERFVEKGGGGGKSSSDQARQGNKTRRAARKQQIKHSRKRQRRQARERLFRVVQHFPDFNYPSARDQFLRRYSDWINRFLDSPLQIETSDLEFSTSKSSGPGGQHVNKRETRVALHHIPTGIRAVSDQHRSQRKNRQSSRQILRRRLQEHLEDWNMYLSGDEQVSPEMISSWLESDG